MEKVWLNNVVLNAGIPQGSVLGPLLFIIYYNNICEFNFKGEIFCFADDTVLLYSGRNWSEVLKLVESELKVLKTLLNSNFLKLNASKTVGSLKIHNVNCPETGCYCDDIKFSQNCKYLGVTFDDKLTFVEHVKILCKRLRSLYYKFYKLRCILDSKTLKNVYFALVQSIINYGISIWGGTHKYIMNYLQITQNKIIKIMLSKPQLYVNESIYNDFNVLKINQLHQ